MKCVECENVPMYPGVVEMKYWIEHVVFLIAVSMCFSIVITVPCLTLYQRVMNVEIFGISIDEGSIIFKMFTGLFILLVVLLSNDTPNGIPEFICVVTWINIFLVFDVLSFINGCILTMYIPFKRMSEYVVKKDKNV